MAKMPGPGSSSSSPASPTPDAASSSIRPKSQSGRAASFTLRRSQSKQERINEILEIGLARAKSSRSEPAQQQPPTTTPPRRMEPLLGPGGDGTSSEDERRDGGSRSNKRGSQPNYQTTAAAVTGSTCQKGNGRETQNREDGLAHRRPGTGDNRRPSNPPAAVAAEGEPQAQADGSLLARLKQIFSSFGSVELDNKGSVARDHLALERTFLAWLRTSVSFASIGIAVTQLFRLSTSLNNDSGGGIPSEAQERLRRLGKPLGAAFLGISILILFLGYGRYVRSQKWIMSGRFPASRGTVILVTLLTFAVMVASLAIVVQFGPGGTD